MLGAFVCIYIYTFILNVVFPPTTSIFCVFSCKITQQSYIHQFDYH